MWYNKEMKPESFHSDKRSVDMNKLPRRAKLWPVDTIHEKSENANWLLYKYE